MLIVALHSTWGDYFYKVIYAYINQKIINSSMKRISLVFVSVKSSVYNNVAIVNMEKYGETLVIHATAGYLLYETY